MLCHDDRSQPFNPGECRTVNSNENVSILPCSREAGKCACEKLSFQSKCTLGENVPGWQQACEGGMDRKHSGRRPRDSRNDPRRERAAGPEDRADAPRRSGAGACRVPGNRSWASERVRLPAVGGLLLLAVGLVFGQTAGFGFVNYDDDAGVYQNRLVTGELSLRTVLVVFTQRHLESWAPLTCLSHMLVWHFLGHGTAVHHLVNVLLHAAAAVVLLVVLWQMTGCLWPMRRGSGPVCRPSAPRGIGGLGNGAEGRAFRAVLHVDVGGLPGLRPPGVFRGPLSGRSALLGSEPSGQAHGGHFAVAALAVGLLAAGTPFGSRGNAARERCGRREGETAEPRFAAGSFPRVLSDLLSPRVVWEKIPMLAIACLFCLLAVHGQDPTALVANQQYSFAWRIGNAMISYVAYLGQFFCPTALAPYYPRRPVLPPWQMAAAVPTLAAVTAAAIWWRRQRPYLLVGWLWYVGMLIPVIGLVQVGAQAEADRFTYLPQIGLSIALVWAVADACRSGPRSRPMGAVAAACGLAILVVSAWRQTSYWCDSQTLWTHTLACTSQNTTAENNLGILLAERGRFDEAIVYYQKALEIEPNNVVAHDNLGIALVERGRIGEAMAHYRRALEIDPRYATAHNNLGVALGGLRPHRRGDRALPKGIGHQGRLRRCPQQLRHCSGEVRTD